MNACSVDIKDMIVSGSLGLTFGTDLFVGREPSDVNECVTIYDLPGSGPNLTLQKDTSNYYFSGVFLRAKYNDYRSGYNILKSIQEYLHGSYDLLVNSTLYTLIQSIQDPELLENTDNGGFVFLINFDIQRRPATQEDYDRHS